MQRVVDPAALYFVAIGRLLERGSAVVARLGNELDPSGIIGQIPVDRTWT